MQVIALTRNVGFAEGNNRAGGCCAGGRCIALLDPDATVGEHSVRGLVRTLGRRRNRCRRAREDLRASFPLTIEQAGAEFNNLGHSSTRASIDSERGRVMMSRFEVPALTAAQVPLPGKCSACLEKELFDSSYCSCTTKSSIHDIRLRGHGYKVMLHQMRSCAAGMRWIEATTRPWRSRPGHLQTATGSRSFEYSSARDLLVRNLPIGLPFQSGVFSGYRLPAPRGGRDMPTRVEVSGATPVRGAHERTPRQRTSTRR